MFAVARKSFAARYGITDPAVIARITPPGPLEPGDFGLTLAVHTAALVAVDAHVRHVRPPADLVGLTAYLLDRERRGWTRLYENRLEGLDFHTPPSVMARTVFTAALTGPANHRKGREILTQLDVEGHPDRLLSDHATCYPPTAADSVLEPLYPDRLAEDFLALSLPGHTLTAYPTEWWSATATADLARRDNEGTPPSYIARTLTFLAAAAAAGRWVHVSTYLNTLLRVDPALAIAAGGAALTALAEAIDMDVLEAIEALLPSGRHVDLDPAAAVITIRLHAHRLASATDDDERARLHAILGYRLGNASRPAEALAATGEAVRDLPAAGRCPARRLRTRPRPVTGQPRDQFVGAGAAGGGAGRGRGGRRDPPAAGRGPARRLRTRPRRVADQPLGCPVGAGAAGGGAGRGRGGRRDPPAAGRGPARRLRTRPRRVAEQPRG